MPVLEVELQELALDGSCAAVVDMLD